MSNTRFKQNDMAKGTGQSTKANEEKKHTASDTMQFDDDSNMPTCTLFSAYQKRIRYADGSIEERESVPTCCTLF